MMIIAKIVMMMITPMPHFTQTILTGGFSVPCKQTKDNEKVCVFVKMSETKKKQEKYSMQQTLITSLQAKGSTEKECKSNFQG